jgi:hypothetical protein
MLAFWPNPNVCGRNQQFAETGEASQTWAAAGSFCEPKKEVKHNLNGEADIAQCHLAPL